MADATVSSPAPGKRRRWLRLLACTLGILVALVLVVYFVATSSPFFKGVILPRVGKALGAKITVSEASISPFRQVVLRDLKLQTTGPEPLVSAAEIRLRYSLLDILGGNLHVEEATLSSPTVVLVQNPDGSMNLDPVLKALTQKPTPKEAKPAPAAKPAKPLQVDLKQLNVTGATVRYVKLYKNGNRDVDELSNVNLAVSGVKNGQTGKLTIAAGISVRNNPPPPGTNALLEAKLSGSYDFALAADLKPGSVKGNTHLEVARAEGALAQAATLGADLDCDLTPAEIKQVALRFQKGGVALGQLRVSGPFDLGKTEGRLHVEIAGIDKQLLNLAGPLSGVDALSGLDFGATTVNATNQVQLAKSGSLITAGGQLKLDKLQVSRAGQTTPRLEFRADYDVTVDRSQNSALLRGLTMTGTQQGNPLLRAELTSPMSLAWGNVSNALGDSALSLTLSGLNLADWQPFLGSLAPAGLVNGQVKLVSQQGGQQLTFDVNSAIENLTAALGSNRITQAGITLQLNGQASNLKLRQFSLRQGKLEVSQQNQPLLTVTAAGVYDGAGQSADLQLAAQALPARLLQAVPQPNLSVSSGTAELKGHLTQQQQTRTVTGTFTLGDFSAKFGTNQLRDLGLTADFDLSLASPQVQIRKATGQLTAAANPGASFAVSGTYDTASQDADLQVTLQAALARLAQLMPQPNLSVASGTAELKSHLTQKQKNQSVTGSLSLADFTGQFGSNVFRSFSATADLDLRLTPQQVQINKLAGKLAQGANPGGAFDLSGTYDLTNQSAQFTARLTDFNQNGLRPFLQPMLADKSLVSVALNANASAQYNPQGNSSVKAGLQVTNLVVSDPKKQFPATPLEAKMQLEAGLRNRVLDLRQCQVALTPTARGTNQVQLTGQLDLSDTNATQGNLKLAADSLDLTTYYDLFAGQNQAAAKLPAGSAPRTAPATAQASPGPDKEPDALKLPLRNFSAQANIRRLYLREVEIADWQTTTKIDGGHLTVNPLKLTLNGAPVNSTVELDLTVPGFKYDLALNAQAIPLAPLVNSFQPERKGILSGTLTAQAKVDGAGTTGASLQKNLTGQFDFSSTNLNLSVDNITAHSIGGRLLITLVGTIAVIPELAKNTASTAISFVEGLAGLGGGNAPGATATGGLTPDLKKSPINAIILHGSAGSGRIDLRQAVVQSPAFEARATGTVTLAEVLTNSTLQIPVSVFLERGISQRLGMAANTPANATYAQLPDFLTIKGTLGNPKSDVNKLALAGAVLQGVGGKAGQAAGKLGGLLEGLGGMVGKPASATNAPNTSSNQPPLGNLLNNLLRPRKK